MLLSSAYDAMPPFSRREGSIRRLEIFFFLPPRNLSFRSFHAPRRKVEERRDDREEEGRERNLFNDRLLDRWKNRRKGRWRKRGGETVGKRGSTCVKYSQRLLTSRRDASRGNFVSCLRSEISIGSRVPLACLVLARALFTLERK